ncbi:MAG: hypothetical protein MJE77_41935 [Proteobacteria bacterium]|nr:hypothetical protein [Pseudomonadota bacterium]
MNEHIEEAQRHEREARAHNDLYVPGAETPDGAPIECLDRPLAGIPYSGIEPIRVMRPCWNTHANPTEHHRAHAAEHLRAASDHRAQAATLIRAERQACAGLGEEEISHSPFFHRDDIARVEPYRVSGDIRGAQVTFKPVRGLTADWLRQSMRCHMARAAVMGYSTTFMGYCPLMLEGVSAEVSRAADGFVVTIRARKDEIAAAILGRARDLVAGQPES